MKTAGYDILLLLNEKFLNEISGVLFYNNIFTFNGTKDFRASLPAETVSKVPASLRNFLEIRYRCKLLHEPHIDFKTGNKIGVKANLRVYIWMMEGLELKFDAKLNVETPISVNNATKSINVHLSQTDVQQFEIKYGYTATQDIVLELDNLFENALHAYFADTRNPLQIPIPTLDQYLPYTEKIPSNIVPISIRGLKMVDNQTMVVAVNLFGHQGGVEANLTNFAKNCNLGIAISEIAMLKVYNFFWARTTWDKTFQKSDSFRIDMVDKIVGFITELIGFIKQVGVKFATLGLIDHETDYISTDFNYTLDLTFDRKPTFDLMDGNRVAIYNFGVDIFLRLKAVVTYDVTTSFDTSGPIPDECTPWKDDIQISKKRKTTTILDLAISVDNLVLTYGLGEIFINEEDKTLQVKVLDFNLNLMDYVKHTCQFWLIPEPIRVRIIDSLKKKIIDSLPPIVLSPSIKDVEIPGIDWPATVEGRKLKITNHEAIVGAYVHFKDLQNELAPVPKYIGNTNNMEVHRAGCDSILDTYETHQVGFYTLQTALKKNFDGCKKCLPAFHKR